MNPQTQAPGTAGAGPSPSTAPHGSHSGPPGGMPSGGPGGPRGPGGAAGPGGVAFPPIPPDVYARRWPAMFVLLAASFMTLLDVSIVNVALPSLQASLQADPRQIQWVVEIYILAYALGLLPLGRLGDIVGSKGMFLLGVSGFAAASALCGAASSAPMLVMARGLQGLAAAMMSPQVMAIAQTMFPPKERASAFSLFGLVAGVAAIAGPLASGLLIHADFFGLGWRLVFLINIPIGIATIAAAMAIVPRRAPHPGLKNDWAGIALAGAAILCLIFPLVEGRVHGWPSWSFVLMAASLLLLTLFVRWEQRQGRNGGSALLPIDLMANRDYLVGSGALMVFFSAMQGFFLVFALFLQQGFHFTPLQAGLATAPFPIGVLAATVLGGRLPDLKRKIVGGALLLTAASAALGVTVHNASAGIGVLSFLLPLLVGGVGAGVCISSLFQAVMRTVPLKDAGSGSGAVQVVQQVGGAVGIALATVIFFSGTAQPALADGQAEAAFRSAFLYTLAYQGVAYLVVAGMALAMKFELPSPAALRPAPASR